MHDEILRRIGALYERKKTLSIGIIGALGCGDVGDEAMLQAHWQVLSREFPEASIHAYCMNAEVARRYIGGALGSTEFFPALSDYRPLKLIAYAGNRYSGEARRKAPLLYRLSWLLMTLLWHAIKRRPRIRAAYFHGEDLLIVLGGGYFNSWHVKLRIYPLFFHLQLFRMQGCPIFGGGLNIGPFNAFDRARSRKYFGLFDLIGLRDWELSPKELAMMPCAQRLLFTEDDALSLTPAAVPIGLAATLPENGKFVLVQVHRWLMGEAEVQGFAQVLNSLCDDLIEKRGLGVVAMPMTYGDPNKDLSFMRATLRNPKIQFVRENLSPAERLAVFGLAKAVLCTRHHSAVFSVAAGKKCLALSFDGYYGNKLRGIKRMGGGELLSIVEIDRASGPDMARAIGELVS